MIVRSSGGRARNGEAEEVSLDDVVLAPRVVWEGSSISVSEI